MVLNFICYYFTCGCLVHVAATVVLAGILSLDFKEENHRKE
jgi:hypothetical protein